MTEASGRSQKKIAQKSRTPLAPIQPVAGKENKYVTSARPPKVSVKTRKLGKKSSLKVSAGHAVQTSTTVGSTSVSLLQATLSHARHACEPEQQSKSFTQDETDDDVAAMLTSEEPTGLYYKLLAEERRIALKETLEENRRLYEKIDDLTHRIKILEEQANCAVYFSSLCAALKADKTQTVESPGCLSNDDRVVAVSLQHSGHRPKLGRQF